MKLRSDQDFCPSVLSAPVRPLEIFRFLLLTKKPLKV